MYSEICLKLEPLGLERVATAVRAAGHDVRLLDLQIFGHDEYWRELGSFAPEAVGFSLSYLANLPEVIHLARQRRKRVTLDDDLRALEVARALDINVAINVIADPDWDERPDQLPREPLEVQPRLPSRPDRQCADHEPAVTYAMRPPAPPPATKLRASQLYVHTP